MSASILLAGGCYSYRATTLDGLPAGAQVRARLTPSGAQSVVPLTGDDSRRINGILVASDADSLVLEVWRSDLRGTLVFEPGLLRVALPREEVLDVWQKQLSYARTGALAALLGVGLYQVYRMLWAGAGGTSDGPVPGGPGLSVCCK